MQRFYEEWDWEKDIGINELTETAGFSSYATAYYDYDDRLIRVCVKNAINKHLLDRGKNQPDETSVYDYFCDDDGRIMEKRSLDDDGSIFLTVRYHYDAEKGTVTETGWFPHSESPPKSIVRKI